MTEMRGHLKIGTTPVSGVFVLDNETRIDDFVHYELTFTPDDPKLALAASLTESLQGDLQ